MPVNECIAYYDESGNDLTGHVLAAVTGKRFVKIAGDQQPGGSDGVTDDIGGGNIQVRPCGAGERAFGVAAYDSPTGSKVPVLRAKKVVPITAGGAITAGQAIMSDATGKAVPYVAPVNPAVGASLPLDTVHINGYAEADAANGADAKISLV